MRKLFALGIAAAVLVTSAPALAVEAALPGPGAASFQIASAHGHKVAAKNQKKKKKVRKYRKYVRKHARAKAKKAG